jgi:hypothetical protein
MKNYEKIVEQIKSREINCEQALEDLAEIGYCPCLFNDDNGHWAVSFDGFQQVPLTNEPETISTTSIIEAEDWKDSIYEALLWALEK